MTQAARLSLRMQKALKLLLSNPHLGACLPLLSTDSDLSFIGAASEPQRVSRKAQIELSRLLSDPPPPGVRFPHLSPDSDMTSIEADIEGPMGTVYEGGVFRVRLEIPESFSFQPPEVFFETPIFHPNVDDTGRVCHEFLFPGPEGSWRPLYGIRTVLLSIWLLLSEPCPENCLTSEATVEYICDREAFDRKARSMTQEYAVPKDTRITISDPHAQPNSNLSTGCIIQ